MIWAPTKDSRIKKRDGMYWARFMKKGRRVEQSLDTKNYEAAKALVDDIEAKLLIGKSWKRERQLFEDAWTEFLIDKKAGNKVRAARDKTMFEYAAFGSRYYIPFFGKYMLGDIDEDLWLQFVDHVRKEHGDILFFNIRKYFSGFMTWAKRHGKVPTPPYLFDPDAKLNQEREEHSPGKAYSRAELKRMLKASKGCGHEMHLFMAMAQFMGFRPPKEITSLAKDRIDLDANVIRLKRVDTKTNTSRVVPIHPYVRPLLIAQVERSGKSPYLFPHAHVHAKPDAPMERGGFRKRWAKVLEAAGVDGRIYDFRHTFITHAIADGMNPAIVAEITGTSLRIIQKHYLHFDPKDLNVAIKSFRL